MSWYLLCPPTKFTNGLIPTVLFVLAESLLYPNTVPNTQENSRFAFHAQNNPSCINPDRKLMLSLSSTPSYLHNKSMFNTQVSPWSSYAESDDSYHIEIDFDYQSQGCHSPLLITTLAPSFPRMPRSCGFGLCPLPFFLLKKPSMPPGLAPPASINFASAGSVASCFANSDQLPVSPSTTCIPPPIDSLRVPVGLCVRL